MMMMETQPKRIFFWSPLSFTDTDDSEDSRGREGTFVYSALPLPPAHEHSDIHLKLCIWDDCLAFLIAILVFTRLLLDKIYHLTELPFDWWCNVCLFTWFDSRFFVTAIWQGKPVDLKSHRRSPLYYKRTDLCCSDRSNIKMEKKRALINRLFNLKWQQTHMRFWPLTNTSIISSQIKCWKKMPLRTTNTISKAMARPWSRNFLGKNWRRL